MRSTVWMWIPALSLGLLGAAPPPPEKDAWTLTKAQGGCRLDADKGALSDGYQNTSVQVRVTATEVRVVSESTFDESKGDLNIQVDKQDAVKADGLDGAKAVVFKGAAATTLIAQFKRGLKANVTLRFWPTWPETGTHSAVVSLIGFTKAWDEMQASCR